jgi:hypothetical protein
LFAGAKENFTVRILELETENSTLKSEISRWRDAATVEAQLKREAEEATNQLKVMLHTANLLENQYLLSDIRKQDSLAETFRKSAIESHQIANEASLIKSITISFLSIVHFKASICSFRKTIQD